jgi:hypothetical protein
MNKIWYLIIERVFMFTENEKDELRKLVKQEIKLFFIEEGQRWSKEVAQNACNYFSELLREAIKCRFK